MDIKTIVMLGKPGAGKGMQSKLLADTTGYKIFSSGNRLREIASHDTSVGRKVKAVIDNVELMPHWFASYLFQEAILHTRQDEGIIYEGSCRKEPEAILFDEVMGWLDRPYRAIFITAPDEVIVDRLLKRGEIEGRADDSEEKIQVRLRAYRDEVKDAIEYFRNTGNLIEINGEGSPQEVHAAIMDALEN